MKSSLYIRCLAVVDSCTTVEQCDTATKYILLAEKTKQLDWESFWLLEKRLTFLEKGFIYPE